MNVVYYISDFFSEMCGVSIESLCFNNQDVDEISFYIVENGLTDLNKSRLTTIVKKYNRSIHYIAMPSQNEIYPDVNLNLGRTYSRLALSEILPNSLDRVLSLDSDTLILGSLKEMYETEFNDDQFVAGVYDCVGRAHQLKILEADEKMIYCNAGMFLVDLNKWRNNNVSQQFMSVIKSKIENKKPLYFLEQDLMNLVFDGHCVLLDAKYNVLTSIYKFSYKEIMKMKKPCSYYTKEEIENAQKNPAIIHATTCFYIKKRMWVEKSDHPCAHFYKQFRDMTPWKDAPMIKDSRTTKKKIVSLLWHFMPRCIAVSIASFMINHLRPKYAKYTSKHNIDTIAVQSTT
ncbi:MAG: glycosyltransferase family 8 protein [Candidatus Coproplasma sp.]